MELEKILPTNGPSINEVKKYIDKYSEEIIVIKCGGRVLLEPDLFNSGIRPAVNLGLSVTRVGSAAQTKAMKSVAGSLKIQMAQFRELETFAQFGTSDLDDATKQQLDRGQRILELLKQNEASPVTMEQQVCMFHMANEGVLDDIPVEKVKEFELGWYDYAESNLSEVLNTIKSSGDLDDDSKKTISEISSKYKKSMGF